MKLKKKKKKEMAIYIKNYNLDYFTKYFYIID